MSDSIADLASSAPSLMVVALMRLENAAKSKLVGLLAERLRDFDIEVGEVTIAGSVKGTSTATPNAIEPADIADTFWSLVHDRDKTRARIAEPGFA